MAVDAIWQMVVWILIGLGSVIGVLALLAVVGCFFPRHHVASRSLRSKRPPEEVWNVVSDYAAVPGWHPEIKKVERLPDRDGHEVWRETDKRGYPVQLETVEAVARAGYRFAYTTCHHRDRRHPLLTIPRCVLWENSCLDPGGRFSAAVASCVTSGIFHFASGCRHRHAVTRESDVSLVRR